MKHTPQFIVWWAISRYLTQEEKVILDRELGLIQSKGNIKFNTYIKQRFDIERLRTEPIIWQDIWIYNYLTLEPKYKISRNPLLTRYEREIMLPAITNSNKA